MSALDRWIPRLIIGVAGLHAIDAVVVYHDEYRDILAAGLIGTVDGHRDREAATWFLVAAPAVAALGFASRWSVERTGRIPPVVPTTLIGLGALIALLSPGPGGIALGALGAAGIAATRRTWRATA
ncbi:MAG: DUF6463 family protein [Ilumatobacteraceae bacterium]